MNRRPSGTWLIVLSCTTAYPASLAAAAEPSEAERDGPEGPAPGFDADVASAYTSNLFHVQRRRMDDFDAESGPGERFDGMRGPWDVATTLGVAPSLRWRLEEKQALELSLRAEYTAHVRNTVANYAQFGAEAEYDLSKRDELVLEVAVTPTRFKKNYPDPQIVVMKIYGRADYTEAAAALAYERRWSKRWSTEIAYAFEQKWFAAPFQNRDSIGHELTLLITRRLGKRVEVEGGALVGLNDAPSGEEFAVQVDRSYYEARPIASVAVDLPSRWDIDFRVAYGFRNYTTDVAENDTHFHRNDRILEVDLVVEKGFNDTWGMSVEAGLNRKDSDRADAQDDPDAVGYEEFVLGVGAEMSFR